MHVAHGGNRCVDVPHINIADLLRGIELPRSEIAADSLIRGPSPYNASVLLTRAFPAVSLFAFGALAIVLGNFQRISTWESVPFLAPFKASQYFVDYFAFGFTKRALLGTAYQIVHTDFGASFLVGAGLALALAILLAFSGLCFAKGCSLLVAVSVALSPFTFQNIGFDLGRTDQLGLLAAVSIVLVSEVKKNGRGSLFYLSSGLLVAASLLSHEAAVFFVPPIAVYLWKNDKSAARIGSFIAPIALALFALAIWGRYEGPIEDINARLVAVGVPKNGDIWERGLADNLSIGLSAIDSPDRFEAHFLLPMVALCCWFVAFGLLARTTISIPLLTVCFAPLLLTPLGVDTARWFGLSGMLGTIMIVSRSTRERTIPVQPWLYAVCTVAIVFLVLSGSAGIKGQALAGGAALISVFLP